MFLVFGPIWAQLGSKLGPVRLRLGSGSGQYGFGSGLGLNPNGNPKDDAFNQRRSMWRKNGSTIYFQNEVDSGMNDFLDNRPFISVKPFTF